MIDGPFSNSQSQTSQFVEAASSIDAVLEEFFDWCTQQNTTVCPLAHQNKTVEASWMDLKDRAEKARIPAPSCASGAKECLHQDVSAIQISQATLGMLYHPYATAPELAAGLYNASFHNDASYFAGVTITKDATLYEASYYFANTAISCQDDTNLSSLSDMRWKKMIASTQVLLLMGASVENAIFVRNCLGWPQPKRKSPHNIDIPHTDDLPPILIVTNLWDPAVPNPMAMNLLYEIGAHRAILLTRKALGNTVVFQTEAYEGPTLAAINKYLLELELPEQGTVY